MKLKVKISNGNTCDVKPKAEIQTVNTHGCCVYHAMITTCMERNYMVQTYPIHISRRSEEKTPSEEHIQQIS